MKTKYFITIAAAMLFMLASLATQAQDVYEYATVMTTHALVNKIYVSYSNGEYKEIDVNKEDQKPTSYVNTTAVLKYIAQLNKEGWELVTTGSNSVDAGWRFFLKRKVK